jgi:hypothetical protein
MTARPRVSTQALHLLCRREDLPDCIDAIRMLVRCDDGASAKIADFDGYFPIHYLMKRGSTVSAHSVESVAEVLAAAYPAALLVRDPMNCDRTAVHVAAGRRDVSVKMLAAMLSQCAAAGLIGDEVGRTAFHDLCPRPLEAVKRP